MEGIVSGVEGEEGEVIDDTRRLDRMASCSDEAERLLERRGQLRGVAEDRKGRSNALNHTQPTPRDQLPKSYRQLLRLHTAQVSAPRNALVVGLADASQHGTNNTLSNLSFH